MIKLLGRGGFGAVFQVQSSVDNKMYAAKLESYEHSRKVKFAFFFSWKNLPVRKRSKYSVLEFNFQVLLMDCLVLRGAEILKSPHFCKIFELGKVEGKFRFIIITMVIKCLFQ